ncbi:MAG: hypothetical protein ABIA74_03070 [bacterium]
MKKLFKVLFLVLAMNAMSQTKSEAYGPMTGIQMLELVAPWAIQATEYVTPYVTTATETAKDICLSVGGGYCGIAVAAPTALAIAATSMFAGFNYLFSSTKPTKKIEKIIETVTPEVKASLITTALELVKQHPGLTTASALLLVILAYKTKQALTQKI